MRQRLHQLLTRLAAVLKPTPDQTPILRETIRFLNKALSDLTAQERSANNAYMERVAELVEARQMAGGGPWTIGPDARLACDTIITEAVERSKTAEEGKPQPFKLRETANAITAQGVYGDIELALQNVEWRREVNISWLEFSRWGIQQIILISRLHYIKNPIIRRLIDVCAAYVFARGVEVSSNDDAANEVLRDFFDRNRVTLGQNALCDLERRKDYDGNLFFVLFADKENSGRVSIRTIDATEMQEVVTDPDDADTPWFYRRKWQSKQLDILTGQYKDLAGECWYPALGYEPAARPAEINSKPVMWESPVLHRKCGGVSKWHFGCPRIYPALDWAKEARKFLEACASVKATLAQIAFTLTTKGGQQALEGAKQQLQTSVGPTSALWDQQPTATAGSTFASGPGTKLEALKTAGAGPDPEEVRQYKLMCCMVAGVPETFLGDVSTGNLATATSLDRPTETVFLEKQEAWREDLVTIARYVLKVSAGAPSGRLRESYKPADLPKIMECKRRTLKDGRQVYEAFGEVADAIEVKADFPAIREGDVGVLVKATVDAMTLDNKAGQVIGIDEKEGVRKLYALLGIENGDELAEDQYPDGEYDPDRTTQLVRAPIEKPQPQPGGEPQPEPDQVPQLTAGEAKRVDVALWKLGKVLKVWEGRRARSHSHRAGE